MTVLAPATERPASTVGVQLLPARALVRDTLAGSLPSSLRGSLVLTAAHVLACSPPGRGAEVPRPPR